MKRVFGLLVLVGALCSCFAGCGPGEKNVVVTDDPKEVSRLQKMMPPRPGQPAPAQQQQQQEAPAQQ